MCRGLPSNRGEQECSGTWNSICKRSENWKGRGCKLVQVQSLWYDRPG